MLLVSESEATDLALAEPIPLAQHPAAVYLGTLAPSSQRTMGSSLDQIARSLTGGRCDAMTLDWSKLRYKHTIAVRNALAQRLKPKTANKMLAGLKRTLQEAYKLELIELETYLKAIDFPKVPVNYGSRAKFLSPEEIQKLIQCCLAQDTIFGIRDACIITLFAGCGLRRQEIVRLELRDIVIKTKSPVPRLSKAGLAGDRWSEVRFAEVAIRHGKGNKNRKVYLGSKRLVLLEKWLQVRGDKPGALICPLTNQGRMINRHLADHGDRIYKIIKRRGELAGLPNLKPHDFRGTFCSSLFDAGIDIFTIQDLMGHHSSDTTKVYDLRGEERKQKAVEKLPF